MPSGRRRPCLRPPAPALALLTLFICPWLGGQASGTHRLCPSSAPPPAAGQFGRGLHSMPPTQSRHGLHHGGLAVAMALGLRGGSGGGGSGGGASADVLVQRAAQALRVLHDPQETQERRREALAIVEGIKKESADAVCMQTAGQLISTDFADPVRHFGFQLYDHLVTQRWEQLEPPARDALKRDLLVIMASRTRPLLQEQRFVLEKLAQAVVGVARREWPDRWATLSGDLRTLATGCSDVQLYLTVLVWRGLAHEAAAADMPAAARAKLVRALQGEQAETLRILRNKLADVLARTSDSEGAGARVLLLLALAGCVEAVVSLAPLKVTAASGVLGAVPHLLGEEAEDDAVKLAALSMVGAVISSKERVEAGSAEADMIWGVMGPILEALAAYSSRPSAHHLTLTKSLAALTADFGVAHLATLARAGGGELSHVGWLLARACSYPALNVVAATLPFWGACTERQRDLAPASADSSLLAEGIEAQMLVNVMACLGRGAMSPLDEEDYVEHDEYRQAVMGLRARVLCVVRKLGGTSPLPMLSLAKHAFVQALQTLDPAACNAGSVGEGGGEALGGARAGARGHVTEEGAEEEGGGLGCEGLTEADMWLRTLETIVSVLPAPKRLGDSESSAREAQVPGDAGATGAGGDAAKRAASAEAAWECEKACWGLVEGLLQATPHRVERVTCIILRALGIFSQVYLRAPDQLICSVVGKVLEALAPSGGCSAAELTARRKVCMGVVHKIAASCAAKLAQHIDELTRIVGNILPLVSSDDRGHLSSFLFLVATRLDPPVRRQAYIDSLLQPLAQEFVALGPLLGKAALPQQLLLCLYAADHTPPEHPQRRQQLEQQHSLRTQVLGLLLTFVGVLRHAYTVDGHWGAGHGASGEEDRDCTWSALGAVLLPVLPAVQELMGGLAYLWHPSVCEAMDPTWQLVLVPGELLVLADPTRRSDATDCGHAAVTEVSGWLRQTREACFELAAQLALMGNSLGYYNYLAAHGARVAAMLGPMDCADSMENRHLRLMLRSGLMPLLRWCPAGQLAGLLQPVLLPLFTLLLGRLERGYAALREGRVVEADTFPPACGAALQNFLGSATLAVVREGTLRLLHREVCDVALALCNIATQSSMLEGASFDTTQTPHPHAEAANIIREPGAPGAGADQANAMQADAGAGAAGAGGGVRAASALEAVMMVDGGQALYLLMRILALSLEWPDDIACSKVSILSILSKVSILSILHRLLQSLLLVPLIIPLSPSPPSLLLPQILAPRSLSPSTLSATPKT